MTQHWVGEKRNDLDGKLSICPVNIRYLDEVEWQNEVGESDWTVDERSVKVFREEGRSVPPVYTIE